MYDVIGLFPQVAGIVLLYIEKAWALPSILESSLLLQVLQALRQKVRAHRPTKNVGFVVFWDSVIRGEVKWLWLILTSSNLRIVLLNMVALRFKFVNAFSMDHSPLPRYFAISLTYPQFV
jgi:hypothetical protein